MVSKYEIESLAVSTAAIISSIRLALIQGLLSFPSASKPDASPSSPLRCADWILPVNCWSDACVSPAQQEIQVHRNRLRIGLRFFLDQKDKLFNTDMVKLKDVKGYLKYSFPKDQPRGILLFRGI